jgi:murein DD-endopeptidase MepM/ murein hydrolase activator NlpD
LRRLIRRLSLGALGVIALQYPVLASDPKDEVPTMVAEGAPPPAVVVKAAGVVRLVPIAPPALMLSTSMLARVIPAAPQLQKMASNASRVSPRVTSSFGYRIHPISGQGHFHTGVDLRSGFGSSVGASMNGTVSFAGRRGGYGNLVILDHGAGLSTYYAHLSTISVATGQRVLAGQVLGNSGSTGRSTGPHLHYEIRVNGRPVDPQGKIVLTGDAVDGGDET